MENCKISSDSGQGNNEWQRVWRITIISVVTLDKVKLTGILSMVDYNFSSDTSTSSTAWASSFMLG